MLDHLSYVEQTLDNTVIMFKYNIAMNYLNNINILVILDASDQCNDIAFNYGSSSTSSRSYDIKITQYECGSNLGGINLYFCFDLHITLSIINIL